MAKKNDMTVTTLDMYNILKSKIGDGEARVLVEFVENKVAESFESKKDELATKNDIYKLDVKIERTKAEIIKWMFIFWAGQTGIMVGILALFRQ
ncbi:MAG: hypothetical protein NTW16_13865 [Bacteroidetes bacterium]|nr:hypothetical protein [Bacteroidota bacterium]